MLLVAQRVRTLEAEGVNVTAYVHGSHASSALARDPQLGLREDPVFRPALMLTVREVLAQGGRVVSFLDVVFPDDLPSDAAVTLVERAVLAWPPGESPAIWSDGPVAVRFYASPETDIARELLDLRTAMMPVFGHVVSELRGGPPLAIAPPQPVRIEHSRGPRGDRFVLDPIDRARLSKILRRTLPASFSIADDTREAFELFAIAKLEQIVVEALTGIPLETLKATGGAVIRDVTGRIEWSAR